MTGFNVPDEQLVELYMQKLTLSEVAQRLGPDVSKGAVQSRLRTLRKHGWVPGCPIPVVPHLSRNWKPPRKQAELPPPPPPQPPKEVEPSLQGQLFDKAFVPLPGTKPVPIEDLAFDHCRWPLNGRPTPYCGEQRLCVQNNMGQLMLSPYCAAHHEIAYPKAKPRLGLKPGAWVIRRPLASLR